LISILTKCDAVCQEVFCALSECKVNAKLFKVEG
jgi:hypothetical protein